MTKREFLTAVSNGEMTDELKEFAAAEIEKMNNSAAARAAKPSKAPLENAPLVDPLWMRFWALSLRLLLR